jgi:hypothetical protein
MRAPLGLSGCAFAGVSAAVAALLVFAASAPATTFPVTNTSDGTPAPAGSLREAIEDANAEPNPPHVVDATDVSGTINLQTALPLIQQDVEIQGPGAAALTVRRGAAAAFRIFDFLQVSAEVSGLTIANGRTTDSTFGGAGIRNNQSTVTLRNSVVSGNVNAGTSTGANGSGILNSSPGAPPNAVLTLINTTVSGNTATDGYGAGIFNSGSSSTVTLRNTTVSGNTAQGGAGCVGGGGIHNQGTLDVVNSTVSGNTGPPNGQVGGILTCSTGTGTATIRNSTIAANRAGPGRTANLGVVLANNAVTMKSTIIGRPLGGPNCLVEAPATLTSQGYNLASDASCNLTATADQPSTNPLLGPLGANGGLTRTMALAPNSPAIDKGIRDGLTTDQRGLTRPVDLPEIPNAPGGGGTDVGAFEVQTLPAPPTPPTTCDDFRLGKVKKNKRKGTAKLTVSVPCPGDLELAKTKKVKADDELAEAEGDEKLKIKPKGKARKRLAKKGKAKVKAEVTYTPTGGEPNTKTKKLKLKRRR